MSFSASPPAPSGHLASPLFKVLPAESRLAIYHLVFTGSIIEVYSQPESSKINVPPSEHKNLLMTCRAIYNEAQLIYWSKTMLVVCDMYAGLFRTAYRHPGLPAFLKADAKCLWACGPRSDKTTDGSQTWLARLFNRFPQVGTCMLLNAGLNVPRTHTTIHRMIRFTSPSNLLQEYLGSANPSPTVQLLQLVILDTNTPEEEEDILCVNYSTGKYSQIPADDSFKRVDYAVFNRLIEPGWRLAEGDSLPSIWTCMDE